MQSGRNFPILTAAIAMSISAAVASAQLTTLVPNNFANVEGNSASSTLFNTGASSLQVLYTQAFLADAGINPGDTITGVAFRRSGGGETGPADDTTFASYNIFMSETFANPASMTNTFANNVIGPQTQVYGGSLTFPANSIRGGATPNDFGPLIVFSTPWQYLGGSMLIEIRRSARLGDTTTILTDVDNTAPSQVGARWLFNLTSDAAIPGTLSNSAQIFKFEYTPIPEPGSLALIGLAAIALCARRRSA